MVSCRTFTEDPETYKSGHIQNIWRSTHESVAGWDGWWLPSTPCGESYWRIVGNNAKIIKRT